MCPILRSILRPNYTISFSTYSYIPTQVCPFRRCGSTACRHNENVHVIPYGRFLSIYLLSASSLAYADRLRIRQAGPQKWEDFPRILTIIGGAIERWEDVGFRKVYEEILKGDWKVHDPYDVGRRLAANSNLSFQGWLAMSDTGPNEGTLRVFPDIKLSNSYIILRPFFRPLESPVSSNPLDPQNWEFDISSPDFPGIYPIGEYYLGPGPNTKTHPHLRLDETMISVPHVKPGDMVFWHCDLIHAVEPEHHGQNDSSVMYIPAVPVTPQNKEYILRQKQHFLIGKPPPDFPQNDGEVGFTNLANEKDFLSDIGKMAMGLGEVST